MRLESEKASQCFHADKQLSSVLMADVVTLSEMDVNVKNNSFSAGKKGGNYDAEVCY